MAAALVTAPALVTASPASAQTFSTSGGQGGHLAGANGGASSATGTGGNGGTPIGVVPGGGGGGAGVTGGGGGSNSGGTAAGGSGGVGAGDPGHSGGSSGSDSGGGGGGGNHGAVVTSDDTNSVTIKGGNGGPGGSSTLNNRSGGGGGAAGWGVVVNGAGISYTNNGTIGGGTGGAGGDQLGGGYAGYGGDGGHGIYFTGAGALANTGTITGGAGGAGGNTSGTSGNGGNGGLGVVFSAGGTLTNSGSISGGAGGGNSFTSVAGGAGVEGANLTIVNSGSISGGLWSDGINRANAITFTDGANTLTLQTGWSLTGNIDVTGSLTFNQSIAVTLPNVISGSGAIIQNGTGALTLSGTNTYTGGTTVSAGTLSISADANLGSGGTLALENGTTLAFTATGTYTHAITVAGDPTFDVANGQTVTQSGVITDGATAGDVIKTGLGTLIFTAANTYTGGTTVEAGTLQLGTGGSLAAAGALTVNGGTFDLNGHTQTVGALSGTGGAITLGSGALTVNQSTDTSYAGTISGTGSLTKSGSGMLTLSGTNTYSGGTTVSGGTLGISSDGNLGTGALALENGTTLAFTAGGTYTHAITVAGDPIFDVASGQTVTQSGVIADGGSAGDVTKTGAGTLVLSGTNTYTGGTTVSAGTLQLSGSGTLGAASGATTVSGGTLDLGGTTQTQNGGLTLTGGTVQNGTLSSSGTFALQAGTVSAALAGSGSLIKTGSGTVILDGVNTFTGGTTVSGGTLDVGDASHTSASLAGDATVGAGGTLAGHGSIGGTVTNTAGGIVSPGGSIGTLTVSGNYTQGASSTLSIEVSPTAASKLVVGGTASLAGTLKLVYDPGVYSNASYDILHAGNISGTFSTVTSNAAEVTSSLAYGAGDVTLTSKGTATIAPTEDTVFSALGTAALQGAQGANAVLLSHLAGAPSGAMRTGVASPAPVRIAMGGGSENLDGLVSQLPDKLAQWGGWLQALGSFARFNASSTVPGFDTQAGGFMAGLDRPVSDRLTLGAAGGYARTHVGVHDGESGTIDTPRLALYASYALGRLALDATAGYGYDRIDARRPIPATGETATSGHDGNEATGAVQVHTSLALDGVTVVPRAGLRFAHLSEGSFTESGSSGFALAVAGRDADSLRPFVGASATESFTTSGGTVWTPRVDAEWSHETLNAAPAGLVTVGGGSFTVAGLVPSRDELRLGAGIMAKTSDRVALYADYGVTLPIGNLFAQTVSAGLRVAF